MLDTAAIEECILGTRTQWRVVDRQPYLAKKIAFLLTTKATICSILFSHQELCLKFVRTGGHYHLYNYSPTAKKFGCGLAMSRRLPVK